MKAGILFYVIVAAVAAGAGLYFFAKDAGDRFKEEQAFSDRRRECLNHLDAWVAAGARVGSEEDANVKDCGVIITAADIEFAARNLKR